jgi:glucose-6-phosphate-specific signal transduction histidine kinase
MTSHLHSTTAARRDLALIVVLTAVAAALAVRFDLSEALFSWTRRVEGLQIDEVPAVLLVFAACLVWFSARRFAEVRREMEHTRELDRRLAAALAENRRLAQQYVVAQESERRALARDLHDELGQYLNAIKIDAVGLRERLQQDSDALAVLAGMIANIDQVQATVIDLIRQLRPVGIDEFGLAGALEHYVAEWQRRLPHAALHLAIGEGLEHLEESHRLTLYRLVQEALTNVARHSQASRVDIDIAMHGTAAQRSLHARIADNGSGAAGPVPSSGLGLVGMRERVQALGGTLEVSGPSPQGFAVQARIPLVSAA